MDSRAYIRLAERFSDYILSLIPEHPEIMRMQHPAELFEIKGFKAEADLSLGQAIAALANAQKRWRRKPRPRLSVVIGDAAIHSRGSAG